MIPLKLKKDRRSEGDFFESKAELFQLYIKPEGDEDQVGDIASVLVGSAKIPAASKPILFILKKSAENSKLPISIVVLEDSLETFPPGTFRFLNYSTKALPISIGDKKDGLAPRSVKVLKPSIPSRGGLISLFIYDQNRKPIFARRLFGQPRDRVMIIFTDSTDPKRVIDTLLIPQIVPVEPKKNR